MEFRKQMQKGKRRLNIRKEKYKKKKDKLNEQQKVEENHKKGMENKTTK